MRWTLVVAGLVMLAGCSQPAVKDEELEEEWEDPEVARDFRYRLGSPLAGPCVSAACSVTPTEPSILRFTAETDIVGFSFNVSQASPAAATTAPAKFVARCMTDAGQPCAGVPDPLSELTGTLPQAWAASGFNIQGTDLLFIQVGRADASLALPIGVVPGTGGTYELNGRVLVAN